MILVDAYPQHDWLLKAVDEATPRGAGQARRRGQRGEEPGGGPGEGGELRVPGLRVPPHPQPLRGVAGQYAPQLKKRTALLRKLKEIFRRFQSEPVGRVIQ